MTMRWKDTDHLHRWGEDWTKPEPRRHPPLTNNFRWFGWSSHARDDGYSSVLYWARFPKMIRWTIRVRRVDYAREEGKISACWIVNLFLAIGFFLLFFWCFFQNFKSFIFFAVSVRVPRLPVACFSVRIRCVWKRCAHVTVRVSYTRSCGVSPTTRQTLRSWAFLDTTEKKTKMMTYGEKKTDPDFFYLRRGDGPEKTLWMRL